MDRQFSLRLGKLSESRRMTTDLTVSVSKVFVVRYYSTTLGDTEKSPYEIAAYHCLDAYYHQV